MTLSSSSSFFRFSFDSPSITPAKPFSSSHQLRRLNQKKWRCWKISCEYSCLEVKGISYQPPGTEHNLLNDVSFSLHEKSFGLIFGQSGSGKTTLLQLLGGLFTPTSGSIHIQRYENDGKPMGSPKLLLPERVGIVFQFPERASLDGDKKAELVKKLHERVKQNIEKKNEQYASKANKGRRRIIFEPGDWVWVHMRNERFLAQRKSKLHPRGDGPFQVLERINDNAYKIDLPGEYNISATFNVADLSPFDAGDDSRTNPFEERGNDADYEVDKEDSNKLINGDDDALHIPKGAFTRARAKRLQETLLGLVQDIWAKQGTSWLTPCLRKLPLGGQGKGEAINSKSS